MSEPTREQPAVSPEVSTRSPWHVSRIPAHLGSARTSTVVLGVLFVAIFALYLNIRPDTTGTATGGSTSQLPAATTAPVPQSTTPAPAPTTETTQEQPTTTEAPTTTATPSDTTTPGLPTASTPPTTTSGLSTPSISSPTG